MLLLRLNVNDFCTYSGRGVTFPGRIGGNMRRRRACDYLHSFVLGFLFGRMVRINKYFLRIALMMTNLARVPTFPDLFLGCPCPIW